MSPNTSPPRPTCMVWRKSPNGGLIMSGVRSPLNRRFPEEWETRPFRPDNLPKFMTSPSTNRKFPKPVKKKTPQKLFLKNGENNVRKQIIHVSPFKLQNTLTEKKPQLSGKFLFTVSQKAHTFSYVPFWPSVFVHIQKDSVKINVS